MGKIRVAIIGAGGYGGCGAIEILHRHPDAEIVQLVDITGIGRKISEIHPHLKGLVDLKIRSFEEFQRNGVEEADVALFATPDGVSQQYAPYLLGKGVKVIDYSGDFRFRNLAQYKEYAKRIGRKEGHESPQLLERSTYGLPEIHRDEIAGAELVGNPGCFAVSIILSLAPVVKDHIIDTENIICDSKTGVSGAGKRPSPAFHYPARHESINAYRVGEHQHLIEMEKELYEISNIPIKLTFTPHVIPISRGIYSTIYCKMRSSIKKEDIISLYKESYRDSPFVKIWDGATPPSTMDVRFSNYCRIHIDEDSHTDTLIIISVIDNLVKGQAGNAIQNMNIMFGLPEDIGLSYPPQYP